MADATPAPAAYFHNDSGALHFWVSMDEGPAVGATVSKETLHYRFRGAIDGSDVLRTYGVERAALEAAVRKRVAGGSRTLRTCWLTSPSATLSCASAHPSARV